MSDPNIDDFSQRPCSTKIEKAWKKFFEKNQGEIKGNGKN